MAEKSRSSTIPGRKAAPKLPDKLRECLRNRIRQREKQQSRSSENIFPCCGISQIVGAKETRIFNLVSITTAQAAESLAALPAFVPATVCTGYVAAWLTNLHDFRRRSIPERLCWSVVLSLAISTIASVLIGKAFSLNAVVAFFMAAALLCAAIACIELRRFRKSGTRWQIGWHPLGNQALALGLLWIALVILSLIDLQSNHQLFMSLTIFDHASRVNWTESILRTGVPPANPLYFYGGPANMRYYYFWNVICAAVARMSHLLVRTVYLASCVWGGFIVAAIIGLYLKYFLFVGDRLRRQFLFTLSLIAVSGFNSVIRFWALFFRHGGLPGPPQVWPIEQFASWYDSFLFVPPPIARMVCCMFAFLSQRNKRK